MPLEMMETSQQKNDQNVDKLNELILKLEERLALMTPNDLKRRLIKKMRRIDQNMESLMQSINDIYGLLGIH